MEVSSQLQAPAALLPRIQSPVSIGYEAGWALGPVNLLSLLKIETRVLGRPTRRLVAIRTDLSRLGISYRPKHLRTASSFTPDRPAVSLVKLHLYGSIPKVSFVKMLFNHVQTETAMNLHTAGWSVISPCYSVHLFD
jgi:hypothetical protein